MRAAALLLLAASFARAAELRVVTFNVAGLPWVHPRVRERLAEIAGRLKRGGYDVAALQEVWRDADAERLARDSGFPYHARSPQAWPAGDGLLLLSRWPILAGASLAFDARCDRWLVLDGERQAHKGALWARLAAPGGPLDVYDTHLVADYPSHRYAEVRARQAAQLAGWIRERSAGRPTLVLGDFNMTERDPLLRRWSASLRLEDACARAARACRATTGEGRIDAVFLPAGSGPTAAAAAFDGLSDHRALAVRQGPIAPLRPQ